MVSHLSNGTRRRPFVAHFIDLLMLLNRNRAPAYLNFAFLIFLCVVEEVLIYRIGLLSAQFYYILLLKDVRKLYIQLAFTISLILFMAIVKSGKTYVASVLYIEWRQQLSERLIEHYFEKLNYFSLNQSVKKSSKNDFGDASTCNVDSKVRSIDNVDQRISQDIDKLCSELSMVIPKIVLSPFTILYYSLQVHLTLGLFGLISCISLFLASTFVNRFFVKSIVKWTYLKGQHEGDYRTAHTNVVKYCEMIAFAGAELQQKSLIRRLLRCVLSVHENLILSQFYLNVSTTIFDYSGSVLSFVIIAIPIFSGSFEHLNEAELSRKISANAFICIYLISCFSKIVGMSSDFGQINGFGYRITELWQAMSDTQRIDNVARKRSASLHSTEEYEQILLRFSNVNFGPFYSVDNVALRKLTFTVREKENLLITGDSGLGKTSILRAIKGLWPIVSGSIYCSLNLNDVKQIMFVTHNSRFAHFFLQDTLSPKADNKLRSLFVQYLREYSLDFLQNPLEDRVPTAANITEMLDNLSPGQVQVLNFLFVFCFQPKLVFLDDATNSLSRPITEKLYAECCQLGITIVTIANNNSMKKFHFRFIRMNEPLA